MDLTEISSETLMEELKRRKLEPEDDFSLVFGTICEERRKYYVEVFRKVKTPDDLNDYEILKLRSRFNPQRFYQGFYFKTDQFESLNERLNNNPEEFGKWIINNKSIKFYNL